MADRASRKKQVIEKREGQILKAALEVFIRKGYTAATIPEIAGSAGIAVGTIYNYYPGKRELFIAVIKNYIINDPLLEIIDNIPEADIILTFRRLMRNRLELMETEPGSLIPYLMSEIARDPELKALWVEQFIQPFFTRIESICRVMMGSSRFRYIEPAVVARAVGGLVIGLTTLRILEGEKSPLIRLSQQEVADALAELILHGLTADSGK